MANLIDKSALVAAIERLMKWQEPIMSDSISFNAGHRAALTKLLVLIDTLEVKEVEETEQRMKECSFRQDICNRYRGTQVKCDGKCSWVVDYLKLKELKAQKGEKV